MIGNLPNKHTHLSTVESRSSSTGLLLGFAARTKLPYGASFSRHNTCPLGAIRPWRSVTGSRHGLTSRTEGARGAQFTTISDGSRTTEGACRATAARKRVGRTPRAISAGRAKDTRWLSALGRTIRARFTLTVLGCIGASSTKTPVNAGHARCLRMCTHMFGIPVNTSGDEHFTRSTQTNTQTHTHKPRCCQPGSEIQAQQCNQLYPRCHLHKKSQQGRRFHRAPTIRQGKKTQRKPSTTFCRPSDPTNRTQWAPHCLWACWIPRRRSVPEERGTETCRCHRLCVCVVYVCVCVCVCMCEGVRGSAWVSG